jgi:DNA-binding XRE family transcriptional regulator
MGSTQLTRHSRDSACEEIRQFDFHLPDLQSPFQTEEKPLQYRSKAARLSAAIGKGLFSSASRDQPTRGADDSQACIRSALRRRRTLGLTQEEAAQLLGISRMAYHRMETGTRRIRLSELAAICAAFNLHVGELVQDGQLATAYASAAKAILGQASA